MAAAHRQAILELVTPLVRRASVFEKEKAPVSGVERGNQRRRIVCVLRKEHRICTAVSHVPKMLFSLGFALVLASEDALGCGWMPGRRKVDGCVDGLT